MGRHPKKASIISVLLGAAILFTERGLDMAEVTLSLGWAIALWVIGGLLFLLAVAITTKAYVLPSIQNIEFRTPITLKIVNPNLLKYLRLKGQPNLTYN